MIKQLKDNNVSSKWIEVANIVRENGIKANRSPEFILRNMKDKLPKHLLKAEDIPTSVDILEKKSPKISEEEVMQAPQTKSKQLVDMAKDLMEIVELKKNKMEAIKQFTKEINSELTKSLEIKKHEADVNQSLKELLRKNNSLTSALEKVIRIDNTTVLWIEKAETEIKNVNIDKLPEEKKAKYKILEEEIRAKSQEIAELTQEAEEIENKVSKIRYVFMKTKPVVSNINANIDFDMALDLYDDAIEMTSGILNKVKNIFTSFIGWIKNIFS